MNSTAARTGAPTSTSRPPEDTVITAPTIDPIATGPLAIDATSVAAVAADILLEAALVATDELPCRVEDADLWFSESAAELERAKGLCAECPVRQICLAGALARREPWGVWGGQIFERGTVIARKRPRGRPRKDATEIAA
jgi:WhiB family transcriptional regulator, redox-sensing transcriptional regulator